MNDHTKVEIHDISQRLSRLIGWLRWGLGGLGAIAIAIGGYTLSLEGRVSVLERADMQRAEQIAALTENIARLSVQMNTTSRDISRMVAQIEAQSQTIMQMASEVSEIGRYLRGVKQIERGNEP